MKTVYTLTGRWLCGWLLLAMATGAVLCLLLRGLPATAQNTKQNQNPMAQKAPKEKAKMGRPVIHFEIGCRDSAATQAFYRDLFDWQITQAGPAAVIDTGGGAGINGHITALGHEPHNYVTVYVQVDDLHTYLDKATALGGKTIVPPVPIPTGKFAWMADPEGNLIGLLQPK
jgi:predicted enzyme related to lactoylglutathione lyase